jgi:PAS domain-containing protein
MAAAQQPLELIIARNLISSIALAAFLLDEEGQLVFFNDTAGALIGRRFEEVGRLRPEEWHAQFGPFDEFGQLLPTGDLPIAEALRGGLPANARLRVRIGPEQHIADMEVSGLPLVGADGLKGAIVVFWRATEDVPEQCS